MRISDLADGKVAEITMKAVKAPQCIPATLMLQEFQDISGQSFHDAFQTWRAANPNGTLLNLDTQTRAKGVCEGCSVDFSGLWAGRGVRVLEVHHKNAIASRTEPSLTKVEELAVLCPNCHALVHLDADTPRPVEDLRAMYASAQR